MPISTFLNGRPPNRGLIWLALSETGTPHVATTISDTGGGASTTWTAGTATACRVDPVGDRGDSRIVGGKIDERSTHIVTVPANTAISAANRFVISGRGTFEVTAVRQRTAESTKIFEVIQIS